MKKIFMLTFLLTFTVLNTAKADIRFLPEMLKDVMYGTSEISKTNTASSNCSGTTTTPCASNMQQSSCVKGGVTYYTCICLANNYKDSQFSISKNGTTTYVCNGDYSQTCGCKYSEVACNSNLFPYSASEVSSNNAVGGKKCEIRGSTFYASYSCDSSVYHECKGTYNQLTPASGAGSCTDSDGKTYYTSCACGTNWSDEDCSKRTDGKTSTKTRMTEDGITCNSCQEPTCPPTYRCVLSDGTIQCPPGYVLADESDVCGLKYSSEENPCDGYVAEGESCPDGYDVSDEIGCYTGTTPKYYCEAHNCYQEGYYENECADGSVETDVCMAGEIKTHKCTAVECYIGSIYYSDGTCSIDYDPTKTPIGVVFMLTDSSGNIIRSIDSNGGVAPVANSAHGRIVALKDLSSDKTVWSSRQSKITSSSYYSIYSVSDSKSLAYALKNTTSAHDNIYNGSAMSDQLKSISGTITYTASQYYPTEDLKDDPKFGAGNWYVPTMGELAQMYGINTKGEDNYNTALSYSTGNSGAITQSNAISAINSTISNRLASASVSATVLKSDYYWSSTALSNEAMWALSFEKGERKNALLSGSGGKAYVRPVLAF